MLNPSSPSARRPPQATGSAAASSWRTTRNPQIELRSAERRVGEYLRALGLVDPERGTQLSRSLVQECWSLEGDVRAEQAVAHAQGRVDGFNARVFGPDAARIEPLWNTEAWRQWPVETWDVAREQPQLPPERDSWLPGRASAPGTFLEPAPTGG